MSAALGAVPLLVRLSAIPTFTIPPAIPARATSRRPRNRGPEL